MEYTKREIPRGDTTGEENYGDLVFSTNHGMNIIRMT